LLSPHEFLHRRKDIAFTSPALFSELYLILPLAS